ncbi:MAG: rRNA pseudouridine synthase [Verrucomicrobia bacterium]|nr:rRNA pseudouridine synthase [Verrucomicrobiota bacterium]
MKTRLQKFLADAGVASRRAAEKIILDGRVTVNGDTVTLLGTRVDPMHDRVSVDGKPVKAKRKHYIVLNKPRRFLTTRKPEGEDDRAIVFDLLPKEWGNLFPVGRLDYDSEGLLFLTNDGDFCLKLTHPRYGVSKIYVALVAGKVEPPLVTKFTKGLMDKGEKLIAQKVRIISATKRESVVELELTEGKNREVRRLFESQGIEVKRLQRVKIGKIKLGELPTGKWRTLTESEIKSLLSEKL